jgi:tRNA(Ile)-lysidine synthase
MLSMKGLLRGSTSARVQLAALYQSGRRSQPVKGMSPLVSKLRDFLHRQAVPPRGLIVAVSGGPDSVALLLGLLELQKCHDSTRPLVVTHLNHQLRGRASMEDEQFVRELHAALAPTYPGLALRCANIDVAAQAKAEGENLEGTARRLRYAWLTQVALECGCGFVATGHTANDQAETVLHRLLRGTGLRGLRGIAARRPLAPGVEVIRPLLDVSREQVLAYLNERGQAYRVDQSNDSLDFTRNRLRHELLPLLAREFNPAIHSVLARLAEQAEATYADVEAAARLLLAQAERPRLPDLLLFDPQRLASAPRHQIRELFHLVWERENWPLGSMRYEEWDRLAAVALGEMKAVDLPGNVQARHRGFVVQIGRPS